MNNTLQMYADKEKQVKAYPITSPDRVFNEKGKSVQQELNDIKSDISDACDSVENLGNTVRSINEQMNINNNLRIVNTTQDMESISNPRAGMLCYIVEDSIYYTRKNNEWEPFGIKRVIPTYTKPVLQLSSSIGLKAELGKEINPTISSEFIKNDAGELLTYKLSKNESIIKNNTPTIEPYTETFTITEDVHYRAEVTHEAGEVKIDNLNKPCPEDQIKAGTLTKEITISACRAFWGYVSDSPAEPTASVIRSLPISNIDLKPGGTIKAISTENTRTVVFAYPASLGDCTRIRYEEFGDNEQKTVFEQITLNIPDASGTNNAIPYRVYYYTAPDTFGSAATFILTV